MLEATLGMVLLMVCLRLIVIIQLVMLMSTIRQ